MIEIVSHCYASLLKQYAVDLKYQLSSLALYGAHNPIRITICCDPDDIRTTGVLENFKQYLDINIIHLDRPSLFRRSIGRNIAALTSPADLVWFADVDYVFHRGCLDGLWRAYQSLEKKPVLVWPKKVLANVDHAAGDSLINSGENLEGLLEINPADFSEVSYTRAIGGIQIVHGDYARQYGYLNNSKKYQQPRNDELPFADFRDDTVFRKEINRYGGGGKNQGRKTMSIDIPALYRIRHYQNSYQNR